MQYCQDDINQGGDGSSAEKVARSCEAVATVHEMPQQGFYYIHDAEPPIPSKVRRAHALGYFHRPIIINNLSRSVGHASDGLRHRPDTPCQSNVLQ